MKTRIQVGRAGWTLAVLVATGLLLAGRNASAQTVTCSANPLATFVVNDTGDQGDASPGNGVCATSGGVCTLRAAFEEANAIAPVGGKDDEVVIDLSQFSSPGTAVTFIQIGTPLVLQQRVCVLSSMSTNNDVRIRPAAVMDQALDVQASASGSQFQALEFEFIDDSRRFTSQAVRIQADNTHFVDLALGASIPTLIPSAQPDRAVVVAGSNNRLFFTPFRNQNARKGLALVQSGQGNRFEVARMTGDPALPFIDLEAEGFLPNDPGDVDEGANRRQNYPDILRAYVPYQSPNLTLEYRLDSAPANAGYPARLRLYAMLRNALNFPESSDNLVWSVTSGQAQQTLERNFPVAEFLAGGSLRDSVVTALAIDSQGNTSETAPPVAIQWQLPPTAGADEFVVTPGVETLYGFPAGHDQFILDVLANDSDNYTARSNLQLVGNTLPAAAGTLQVETINAGGQTRQAFRYIPSANPPTGFVDFTYQVQDEGDANDLFAPLASTGSVRLYLNRRPQTTPVTVDTLEPGESVKVLIHVQGMPEISAAVDPDALLDDANTAAYLGRLNPLWTWSGQQGVVRGSISYGYAFNPDSLFYIYTAPTREQLPPDLLNVDVWNYAVTDFRNARSDSAATLTFVTRIDPVARPDAVETLEDTPVSFNVFANDEIAGTVGPNEFAVIDGPFNGELTIDDPLTGQVTYTPNPDWFSPPGEPDVFTYAVCSERVVASKRAETVEIECPENKSPMTATGSISVIAVPDAPVAVPDRYDVIESTSLTIPAPGVLANDTDADGDVLTAILVRNVAFGSLTLNSDGGFTYTPNAGHFGKDSFSYRASDGALTSDSVTVTLDIGGVNDPPVAVNDRFELFFDVGFSDTTWVEVPAPGVLANDTDADGDPLIAILTGDEGEPVSAVDGGLMSASGFHFRFREDGSLRIGWTEEVNGEWIDYNEVDSLWTFTYLARDPSGLFSEGATVQLAVFFPFELDRRAYAGVEDEEFVLSAPGLLAGVTSPSGRPLRMVLYDFQTGTWQDDPAMWRLPREFGNQWPDGWRSVTLADAKPDGSFRVVPGQDYDGDFSLEYRLTDGIIYSAVSWASVNFAPVNDPPVANDDAFTVDLNGDRLVPAPGVLANDADVDYFWGPGEGGSFGWQSDPLVAVFACCGVSEDGSFTVPVPTVMPADSTVTFRYVARDKAGAESDSATVTIRFTSTPVPPAATPDSYSVEEDQTLTVAAPGVLANDIGPNGPLTANLTQDVQHGTLTLSPDGGFTYVPDSDFHGTDTFRYYPRDVAFDDPSLAVTVTITVTPINDPPVAQPDSYETDEGQTLDVPAPGVLANDSDVDGDPLSAQLVSGPAQGVLDLRSDGSFTYTPDAGFSGTDAFVYRASDGQVLSEPVEVTITVADVNFAPVALPELYVTRQDSAITIEAPGVLANDTDADGDPLTAELVTGPTRGTLALQPDGGFTYTPDAGFAGRDEFTYRASDGLLTSAPARVTISVLPLTPNEPPVAVADSFSVAEDSVLIVEAPGLLANDSDPDGDELSVELVTDVQFGTLALSEDGGFVYTPDPDYHGEDGFTYAARDPFQSSEAVAVAITVTPVNDPPVADADAYDLSAGATLSIAAPGVLANDTDADGDPLTAVLVDNVQNGTLTLNADGGFTYTPEEGFSGSDSFTYRASDGQAESESALVTLNVSATNRPPIAVDDAASTLSGQSVRIDVLANDSDPDGDPLQVVEVSQGAGGSAVIDEEGAVVYTPRTDFSGTEVLTYRIEDGRGGSATANIVITVSVPAEDLVVIELPTLGGVAGRAYGINDAGLVVGTALDASGAPHAVVWENGVVRDLGTLGGRGSQAHAVNNAGIVVGASERQGGTIEAFRYEGGNMTGMGSLGGGLSAAYGVNRDGFAAGSATTAAGDLRGFIWTTGPMSPVSVFGAALTEARGIDDAGRIAGFAGPVDAVRPFAGVPASPVFVSTVSGWALGMSADGDAVGSVVDGGLQAVLWPKDGPERRLGPGEAFGVNDAGLVVGRRVVDGASKSGLSRDTQPSNPMGHFLTRLEGGASKTEAADARAMFWTPSGGKDLNDLLPAGSPWVLVEARAVNASGQIAGYGLRDNQERAFVALPAGAAPNVMADSIRIVAGEQVVLDVLANDVHGRPLEIVRVSSPEHGTAEIVDGRRIAYRASATFAGRVRFRYTVSDGALGLGVGEVTIEVSESPRGSGPAGLTNYPNPFSGRTTLAVDLAASGDVRIEVVDLLGQRRALLVDGLLDRGRHDFEFDARALSAGVYVCRLTAGADVVTRMMVVVR